MKELRVNNGKTLDDYEKMLESETTQHDYLVTAMIIIGFSMLIVNQLVQYSSMGPLDDVANNLGKFVQAVKNIK